MSAESIEEGYDTMDDEPMFPVDVVEPRCKVDDPASQKSDGTYHDTSDPLSSSPDGSPDIATEQLTPHPGEPIRLVTTIPPKATKKPSLTLLSNYGQARTSKHSEDSPSSFSIPRSPMLAPQIMPIIANAPFVNAFYKEKLPKRPTFHEDPNQKIVSPGWRTVMKKVGVPSTVLECTPSENIFVPIMEDGHMLDHLPLTQDVFHPVQKQGIEDKDAPIHTNKFYANAFLGNQDQPVWTYPYHIWWGKGHTDNQFPTWGMNIAHIEEQDLVMPDWLGDVEAYSGPKKRQSLILTAVELLDKTVLTTKNHKPFSVDINLKKDSETKGADIMFPVVQGMSFVSGAFRDVQPVLQCPGKGFTSVSGPHYVGSAIIKYRVIDADGRNWLFYNKSWNVKDKISPVTFSKQDPNTLVGPADFNGLIQVAKNPLGTEGEAIYDRAAGACVKEACLTASANDNRAHYTFTYQKIGDQPLLMFALPHHVQSLDPELKPRLTKLTLRTITKGTARALWSEKLTCIETTLPADMYSCTKQKLSRETLDTIERVAISEWNAIYFGRNSYNKTPEGLYDAGRHLAKIATLVFILKYITSRESTVCEDAIKYLKDEITRFAEDKTGFPYPFAYDMRWYGVVSRGAYPSSPDADFKNVLYNEHHSHWSYFVYAASCIALCDIDWLKGGRTTWDNRKWVNTLVKDYAESDYNGRDFPFSRCFDWWHGHSWCQGLSESQDGKDLDSCGEDGFASFAIKLWGKVVGDSKMEQRGNLMLALQARSFRNYFFIETGNTNHPGRYIGTNLAGILSENKVQHATYFGNTPSLTHGHHMSPISPATPFLRPRSFVKEEWESFFSNERWKNATGSWRGVLMANYALVDAKASWDFFRGATSEGWKDVWLDPGTSRAWYLVFAAGQGGAK